MSDQREYLIAFEDLSPAEANVLAAELQRELTEGPADVEARVIKEDPTSMDAGGTLLLILGTEAVVAIAYGIANLLSRYGAKVTITKKKNVAEGTQELKIVTQHVGGADVERIVEALQGSDD
jgi:hypothetical protein